LIKRDQITLSLTLKLAKFSGLFVADYVARELLLHVVDGHITAILTRN